MNSEQLAKKIRLKSLQLVHQANSSHIGGALSMTDILAVLYTDILNITPGDPKEPQRDRLLLSKGHCCTALYSVLAYKGFFPVEEFDTYGENGSRFLSHITHKVPGVEISSGSLGHGLSIACGLALAAKRKRKTYKTYCIVGDGEMDEGSNWEALLFAAHYQLNNLCLIIDYNKIQSLGYTNEVINLEPLQKKLEAFNWHVIEIDGHNHSEIYNALKFFETQYKPTVIIAHTIKGKGVSFMEDKLLWHYKSPNEIQYQQAIKEIEERQ
jgi:transketolase